MCVSVIARVTVWETVSSVLSCVCVRVCVRTSVRAGESVRVCAKGRLVGREGEGEKGLLFAETESHADQKAEI